MDDVYELLVRNKTKNESFSDVIRKNFSKKNPIDFFGAWSDLTDDEFRQVEVAIAIARKTKRKYLK